MRPIHTSPEFAERRIRHLYYRVRNTRCVAGHMRIFGDRPGRGWMIYHYGEQAPGWALQRTWNFGLFAVHHVEKGKKTTIDPGWFMTFASIRFKREYGGFSVRWAKANLYPMRRDRR